MNEVKIRIQVSVVLNHKLRKESFTLAFFIYKYHALSLFSLDQIAPNNPLVEQKNI